MSEKAGEMSGEGPSDDKSYICLPTGIAGMTHTCVVPNALGNVTRLKQRHGRIIAETESGIEMIVPTPGDQ